MKPGPGHARWLPLAEILLLPVLLRAQEGNAAPGNEIPIERCDLLPVVRVQAAGHEMYFLLDTGATTLLNVKSFSAGSTG